LSSYFLRLIFSILRMFLIILIFVRLSVLLILLGSPMFLRILLLRLIVLLIHV